MTRTPRQLSIADHLWEVFGSMAEEMGSDRDALVNEAMHAYARLHGYLAAPGSTPARAPAVAGPAARERRAVTARVLDTAERLERDIVAEAGPRPPAPPGIAEPLAAPPVGLRSGVLRLRRDDGAVVEVDRDRFVIGRGGHCDLIIDSAKISREHAALVRDAEGWWIEDLGSSNGTWVQGERVKRRRLGHGDEFFLCAERFRCALR